MRKIVTGICNYIVIAYSPCVGKLTPGLKDLVTQVLRKFSPAQPSNPSRRHPNNFVEKAKDTKKEQVA
ncbi:hypothetical protein TNCV_376281 [Trichonephila clavipes]|nr:hypothetical protein TNCV_376281 [Trichonephila clavipes]